MEYTIKSGKYTAVILQRGAELVSFSDGEREYIWTGDAAFWNGHNPLLFPVIGRMKNGRVAFDGEVHEMPKHGFARGMDFTVTDQTADSISLELSSNEETKKSYPFDFVLTVTHIVSENGFKTSYTVKNNDEERICFNIGGHTGINLPALGTDSIEGCELVFNSVENASVYYGDENLFVREDYKRTDVLNGTDRIALNCSLFDGDALMISDMKSRKVSLFSPQGKGVEMDFSGFPVLGVWTPPQKNAPFVCLEPWHGLPAMTFESGEFCEKPHLVRVDSGNEATLSYSLNIID